MVHIKNTGQGASMTDRDHPDDSPDITMSLATIEPAPALPVPVLIAAAGERASLRFIDFFTAHIRNPNTRAAYGVATRSFLLGSSRAVSPRSARSAPIMSRPMSRC
jgi:hypothetical protein